MTTYDDDDLVYVDTDARTIVSKVDFDKNGKPEALEMPPKKQKDSDEGEEKKDKKKKPKKRYYPWGTYRTMKKLYRIEGKEKEIENYKPLDDAMKLAVDEPYWD